MNSNLYVATRGMRDAWDKFACEDAMHHIASERKLWNEEDFFKSGERDTARYLDPILGRYNFDPRDRRVLELGCGVGRMSFPLAGRFAEVNAVDISQEMISRAKINQEKFSIKNVVFRLGNGKDLRQFDTETIDLCFSFIVLQHIPDVEVIFEYIREMGRVLRVGGMAIFQINGYRHVRLPAGRYLSWGVRNSGRLRKVGINSRPFVRIGTLNLMSGVPIKAEKVHSICQSSGVRVEETVAEGTQYMWIIGRKLGNQPLQPR